MASLRIFSEELKDSLPNHKRRKTGVNAIYDNMIKKMNNTLHSSRPKKRKRTRSSASSSSNSHETPATPIDSAYNAISEGRKMTQNAITAPLPDWLSDTLSTLEKNNPLRLLLPDDSADSTTSSGDLHDSSAQRDCWPPHNLGFIPFSTPGPGSHLSSLSASSPNSSSSASFPPDSIISTALTSRRSPSPPPLAAAQDKVQLTETNLDELLFHSQSPHAQSHASKLLLPSRFRPKTAILPNIFSAPGPVYYTSHPIYYDSPTQDPSSDPIEMQDINFQWQPFVRTLQENSAQSNPLFQFHDQENNFTPQPRTPENLRVAPSPEPSDPEQCYVLASPGPFRYNVPSPSPIILHQSSPAVFVPEPGIYLSPLRDNQNEDDNDVEGKRDSPSGSQSSNDSIESWSV